MEPLNGHNPYQYGEGVEERRRSDKDSDRHRDRDRDRDRDRHRDRDGKRERSRRSRSRSRSRKKDYSKSKSRSPPVVTTGRRRKTLFDVPPAAGAADAPASVLPGPPPILPPSIAPAVAAAPVLAAATGFSAPANAAAPFVQPPSQQATRHARRVYVGGLPPSANEQSIAYFFSNALAAVGGNSAGPGNAVVNVYINREKNFAFVEFRTVEETSNAMALDGIMFEGVSVRVRRPNDYNPAAAATLGPSVPSPNLNLSAIGLSAGGASITDAHERVFVGGLPYYLNEEQCRELLGSFGPIKSFDLVKDRETGNSKGYGFVVYADPTVTDIACAGLNGLKMGDRTLTVRRATEQAATEAAASARPIGAITGATTLSAATRIIILAEAVTIDELRDDSEYSDILEDMREECGKYGPCVNVIIPRPTEPPPSGLGKVIVEFSDVNAAVKACNALHGRRFGGRTVMSTYLSEEAYAQGDFD